MESLKDNLKILGAFIAYILVGLLALAFAIGSFIISIILWLMPYIIGLVASLFFITHFFPAS